MPNVLKSTAPNAANDPELAALDAPYAVVPVSASGAIMATQGTCPITAASTAALTLAAPVAGLPSAGGNDGQHMFVIDTTGHAHTVTTPTNAINGSKHVITFGGTAASFVELRAYNGVWYVLAQSGVTLS